MKRAAAIGAAILVIFAGLVAGGLMIAHSKPPVKPAPTVTQQAQTAPTVQELWQATNQERQKAGDSPLVLDPVLDGTADSKCKEMVAENRFEHTDVHNRHGYQYVVDKYPNATKVSENLSEGYFTADQTVQAWMASPEHKAALLDPVFTNVGFATCSANNNVYVVQHFAALP